MSEQRAGQVELPAPVEQITALTRPGSVEDPQDVIDLSLAIVRGIVEGEIHPRAAREIHRFVETMIEALALKQGRSMGTSINIINQLFQDADPPSKVINGDAP